MKYAPVILLMLASSAFARDRSIAYLGPNVKAQLRQIESLTSLEICQLADVAEQQRACYNEQVLMHYNRISLPPTTVVDLPPNRFFTRHR